MPWRIGDSSLTGNTKERSRKKESTKEHKKIEKKEKTLTEKMKGQKSHKNTWKLNYNISMITDAFLDQKRENVVCEYTVKTAPHESFPKLFRGAVFTMCSHTFTLF